MPSSSRRLTSVASVKRGGGSVKCCAGLPRRAPRVFHAHLMAGRGRHRVASSFGDVVAAFLIELEKALERMI